MTPNNNERKKRTKNWLSIQIKGKGITLNEVASAIGVSRPKLNKLIQDPKSLTSAQLEAFESLGLMTPILSQYVSTVCPTCGGYGKIYRERGNDYE